MPSIKVKTKFTESYRKIGFDVTKMEALKSEYAKENAKYAVGAVICQGDLQLKVTSYDVDEFGNIRYIGNHIVNDVIKPWLLSFTNEATLSIYKNKVSEDAPIEIAPIDELSKMIKEHAPHINFNV